MTPPSKDELKLMDQIDELIVLARLVKTRCESRETYRIILRALRDSCLDLTTEIGKKL